MGPQHEANHDGASHSPMIETNVSGEIVTDPLPICQWFPWFHKLDTVPRLYMKHYETAKNY